MLTRLDLRVKERFLLCSLAIFKSRVCFGIRSHFARWQGTAGDASCVSSLHNNFVFGLQAHRFLSEI